MPPSPVDCEYCLRGLLDGHAEQYWEDHLRKAPRRVHELPADREAGLPEEELLEPLEEVERMQGEDEQHWEDHR